MSAAFLERPTLFYDERNGRRAWRLTTECRYKTGVFNDVYPDGIITVPVGYCTDLASVPRLPMAYLLCGGKAVLPAIVHDYLYEHGAPGLTRKQADLVFYEAMVLVADPPSKTTSYIMYLAVRIFASGAWNKYRGRFKG